MRFLGTRANQNFFKLELVTHENGPMSLFGSRVILEVERQQPKLIFWSQKCLRQTVGEGRKERKERRERRREKTCEG